MFFDNLAGIIERHLPEFVGRLGQARIFRMEARDPDRSVAEDVAAWEPDQRTIENFRLPFPVVAFEDAADRNTSASSCIVLWPINEAGREYGYLVGSGKKADTFIATGTLKALPNVGGYLEPDHLDRIVTLTSIRAWRGSKKGGVRSAKASLAWIDPQGERMDRLIRGDRFDRILAKYGSGDPTWEDDLEAVRGDLERVTFLREALNGKIDKLETNMTNMRCGIAVMSVLIVNEPASFIVEERPLYPDHPNSIKQIQRSAGRSHFIVLTPRKIRDRFIYPAPDKEEQECETARKTAPHERRGHYRRLQAERFKAARGKVIWIEPMWVGPTEAVRGQNKYTVRLDL